MEGKLHRKKKKTKSFVTKRIPHKVLENGSRKYFARAYPGFSKAVTTYIWRSLFRENLDHQALPQPAECIPKLLSDDLFSCPHSHTQGRKHSDRLQRKKISPIMNLKTGI